MVGPPPVAQSATKQKNLARPATFAAIQSAPSLHAGALRHGNIQRCGKGGGPARTRTWDLTVMSGQL